MSVGIAIEIETARIGFVGSKSSALANSSVNVRLNERAVGSGSVSEPNAAAMCTEIRHIMETAADITAAVMEATTTAKSSAAIVMDWIVVKRMLAIAGPLLRTTRATIAPETPPTAKVFAEVMK
jgi:hypothetical protein